MPVVRCSNGKYRIGEGECVYGTKAKADAAYRGYLFQEALKRRSGGSADAGSKSGAGGGSGMSGGGRRMMNPLACDVDGPGYSLGAGRGGGRGRR